MDISTRRQSGVMLVTLRGDLRLGAPVDEFRKWAHPYFAGGKGWTFTPRQRHLYFSKARDVAWFDEVLESASFGECRGTGVLQRYSGEWKVEQYNLTIPIPNELADEVVGRIRALSGAH